MIPLEQHLKYVSAKLKRAKDNKALLLRQKKENNFSTENEILYFSDLELILDLWCNASSLHPRKCEACGNPFIPKAKNQKACDDKCRVRLHRMKKQDVSHD